MLAAGWQYALGVIFGLLAMGAHVYISYGGAPLLAPVRLFDSLGSGLLFGHGLGFAFLAIHIIKARLTNRRARFVVAWLVGAAFASVAWWTHHGLFLANTKPDWLMLFAGGLVISVGSAAGGQSTRNRILWTVFNFASVSGLLFVSASGAIGQHPLLHVLPQRPLIAVVDLAFVAAALSLTVLFSRFPRVIFVQD